MDDRLIVAVSAHPVVYDKTLVDYKDPRKKAQIWASIGYLLDMTGEFDNTDFHMKCR